MGETTVHGQVYDDATLGRVLVVRALPLDLEWVCHMQLDYQFETCADAMSAVTELFDTSGKTNLCLCAQGEIDLHDARMRQVIQSLASTLWYQNHGLVHEVRLVPTFTVRRPEARHAPEVVSCVARLGAWLVQSAPRLGITSRPFVFYHEGDEACPMHFHVLCLDPEEGQ